MKTLRVILLVGVILSLATACNRKIVFVKTTPAHRLPPGHAKKLFGSKSAKPFAPGQQKKKH